MEEMHTKKVLEPVWWFFQIITGILLLVLVSLHLYVTHFASEKALDYSSVIGRLSSPGFKVLYAVLLLAVVYHGINGMRAIFLDLTMSDVTKRIVNILSLIVALLLFGYGVYLLANIG